MKNFMIAGFAVLIMMSLVSMAFACNCGKSKGTAIPQSCQCTEDSCGASVDSVVKDAEQVNNELCPVSGRPIGSMGEGVISVYEGKAYQLCCVGCVKVFQKEPDKYLKK